MSTSLVRRTRWRAAALLLALVAAACVAVALGASQAHATTTGVSCTDNATTDVPLLQAALTASGPTGANPGQTVVISGLCAGAYTIPSGSAFTIEGAPSSSAQAGFDGQHSAQTGPLLSGNPVGGMTLENLTFENAVTPEESTDPSTLSLDFTSGTLTLSGDTFTNNENTDAPPVAVFADTPDGNDDFDDCEDDPYSQTIAADDSLVIEHSAFTDETMRERDTYDPTLEGHYAAPGGGAGLAVVVACSDSHATLTDNQFVGNSLIANQQEDELPQYYEGTGAGLSFLGNEADYSRTGTLVQSGNVFDSNEIRSPGPGTGLDYAGAGEYVGDAYLKSSDDQFSNNVLPGSDDDGNDQGVQYLGSAGAGLAVVGYCADSGASLSEDVVANNTIAADADGQDGDSFDASHGAGIYFFDAYDCGGPREATRNVEQEDDTQDVTLDDSTVTNNAVTVDGAIAPSDSGATAGIFVASGPYLDASPTLELDNTILDGDVGGAETTFNEPDNEAALAPPANVIDDSDNFTTATNSDYCESDGITPYAGTADYPGTDDICANPQLIDSSYTPPAGAASAETITAGLRNGVAVTPNADVHETSSSPTIDAGSNDLVADGLTTDFYGAAREVNSTSCPVAAGTVDIGAAEFAPTCHTTTTTTTTSTPAATTPTATSTPAPSVVKVQACASRRDVVMHLHYEFVIPPSVDITKVDATLTSSTVASFGVKHLTAFGSPLDKLRLNFKTLPYGTYRVHIHVTLSDGKTAYQQRVWHTCRPFHWKYPIRHHPPRNTTRAAH